MTETISPGENAADKKQRWWHNPSHIIQAGTLLFVAVYTGVTACILIVNSSQRDIARQQYETDERPWMQAEFTFTAPIVFDANGVHSFINFSIKNSGKTPARNVRFFAQLTPPINALKDVRAKEIQTCDPPATGISDPNDFGFTIFPNSGSAQVEPVGVTKEDIDKSRTPDGEPLLLFVCLRYKFLFGDDVGWHQTSYIYELDKVRTPGLQGAFDRFNPDGDTVQPGQIVTLTNPQMPGHVD